LVVIHLMTRKKKRRNFKFCFGNMKRKKDKGKSFFLFFCF
jgi:hypothetical protein